MKGWTARPTMVMKKDANKICVLLVEDDQAIRETMAMVLETEDFEVHTAEDGRIALDMIAKCKTLPDVVITDLMMPFVTGWELVDTLHKLARTRHLPIIVYSAVAHYNARNESLEGCFFLRKPVELDVLFDTLKKALSNESANVRQKEIIEQGSTTAVQIQSNSVQSA